MDKWMTKTNKRIVLFFVLTISVYIFMKYIFCYLLPFFIGLAFVIILNPCTNFIKRKLHIGKGITTAFFMFLIGSIPIFGIWQLGNWIMKNSTEVSSLFENAQMQIYKMVQRYSKVLEPIIEMDALEIEQFVYQNVTIILNEIQSNVVPNLVNYSLTIMKYLGIIGAIWAIVVIFTIMLAKEYDYLIQQLVRREKLCKLKEILKKIFKMLKTYVRAEIIIMSITSAIVSIGFLLMGFSNWLLWGIIIGLLDVFPFIGTGITLIPLAIWQFISGNILNAVGALLLYGICSFTREFSEPRLIGKKVGVHPIIMLMSIYLGVQLFGICGIITGPISFLIIWETYKELTKDH